MIRYKSNGSITQFNTTIGDDNNVTIPSIASSAGKIKVCVKYHNSTTSYGLTTDTTASEYSPKLRYSGSDIYFGKINSSRSTSFSATQETSYSYSSTTSSTLTYNTYGIGAISDISFQTGYDQDNCESYTYTERVFMQNGNFSFVGLTDDKVCFEPITVSLYLNSSGTISSIVNPAYSHTYLYYDVFSNQTPYTTYTTYFTKFYSKRYLLSSKIRTDKNYSATSKYILNNVVNEEIFYRNMHFIPHNTIESTNYRAYTWYTTSNLTMYISDVDDILDYSSSTTSFTISTANNYSTNTLTNRLTIYDLTKSDYVLTGNIKSTILRTVDISHRYTSYNAISINSDLIKNIFSSYTNMHNVNKFYTSFEVNSYISLNNVSSFYKGYAKYTRYRYNSMTTTYTSRVITRIRYYTIEYDSDGNKSTNYNNDYDYSFSENTVSLSSSTSTYTDVIGASYYDYNSQTIINNLTNQKTRYITSLEINHKQTYRLFNINENESIALTSLQQYFNSCIPDNSELSNYTLYSKLLSTAYSTYYTSYSLIDYLITKTFYKNDISDMLNKDYYDNNLLSIYGKGASGIEFFGYNNEITMPENYPIIDKQTASNSIYHSSNYINNFDSIYQLTINTDDSGIINYAIQYSEYANGSINTSSKTSSTTGVKTLYGVRRTLSYYTDSTIISTYESYFSIRILSSKYYYYSTTTTRTVEASYYYSNYCNDNQSDKISSIYYNCVYNKNFEYYTSVSNIQYYMEPNINI